jgi:hypothetical protein
MKKALTLIMAIALPFSTAACTQTPAAKVQTVIAANQPATPFNTAQSNGYIVTAKDEAAVRRVYAKFSISVLRAIGNGLFEMKLQNDPGLAELSNAASHSGGAITTVQPNFSYQAN